MNYEDITLEECDIMYSLCEKAAICDGDNKIVEGENEDE